MASAACGDRMKEFLGLIPFPRTVSVALTGLAELWGQLTPRRGAGLTTFAPTAHRPGNFAAQYRSSCDCPVGSLRRSSIRRQGIFCGVHVYILRALCVIQCNWWATKLRLGRTCAKGVNPDSGKYRKMTLGFSPRGCCLKTQAISPKLRKWGFTNISE